MRIGMEEHQSNSEPWSPGPAVRSGRAQSLRGPLRLVTLDQAGNGSIRTGFSQSARENRKAKPGL